jgi:Protein of unknown function (DUF3159)
MTTEPHQTAVDPGGARSVLLRGAPRLVLNSVGPIGAYALASHLTDVLGGVLAASVTSVALFLWERSQGRPGILARLSLAVVLLQVVMGLIGRSPVLYFLPSVGVDLVEGAILLVSCLTRFPLFAAISREILPLPKDFTRDPAGRRLFVGLTFVWACYFLIRGAISLSVLLLAPTSTYLLVRVVLDAPLVIALAALSLRYAMPRIRLILAAQRASVQGLP